MSIFIDKLKDFCKDLEEMKKCINNKGKVSESIENS